MSKTEFLEVLGKELERLETVEHVSDLANNGRYAEVDAIVAEIDYTALEEYMDSEDMEELTVSEIPEGRYLAFAIYVYGSGEYSECDIMDSWKDFQEAVRGCGKAGESIATTLTYYTLNSFDTFEQLVSEGWKAEDEEDFF